MILNYLWVLPTVVELIKNASKKILSCYKVKFYLNKLKDRQLRNYREPGSTYISESPRLCAGEQFLSPESPGWTLHRI